MNKILSNFLFIGLLFCFIPSNAQFPRGNQIPSSMNASLKGNIIGIVKDSLTDQVLEYATITIKLPKTNKTFGGAISKSDGKFIVDKLRTSEEYNVEVSFIGYQTKKIDKITIQDEPPVFDLGEIRISQNQTLGNEVEVTAKKEFQEIRIDKKVFNLTANPTFIGTNLSDALAKIPAIEVDQDGNISLRGKGNPTILIDGRPLPMSSEQLNNLFKQMPTSMIDNIEVVTNPSAKYEATGMSGIINIVMKKNSETGESYGGGVTLGYGTWDRYNAFLNGNYRKNSFSAFASAGYSRNVMEFNSLVSRDTKDSLGATVIKLNQTSEGSSNGNNLNANLRLDYNFTPKTSLSLSSLFNTYSGPTTSLGKYDQTLGSLTNNFLSYSTRVGDNSSSNTLINGSLSFKQQFEGEHQLTTDINFTNSKTKDDQKFTFSNFINDKTTLLGKENIQNDNLSINNKGLTYKLDYSLPISKGTKIETGYKGEMREINNDVVSQIYNDSLKQFISNPYNTSTYKYDDNYNAGYLLVNHELTSEFSLQAGVRVENTNIIGGYNNKTDIDKSFLDIFPSGSILYKIADNSQLQLGYSKRINRPRFDQLIPYTSRYDVYSRYIGNPNLNPEYTHAIELNYNTFGDWGSFTLSPFVRVENGSIRHVTSLANNITTTTQVNFGTSTTFGSEMSISTKPFNWLNFTLNLNGSSLTNDGSEIAGDVSSNAVIVGGNLNAIFSIYDGLDAVFSSRYRSKGQIGYSRRLPNYGSDLAISYRMMSNNLIFSLRLSDLFDTQRMAFQTEAPDFYSSFEMKSVSRIAFLNIVYNFGQKLNLPRQKQNDSPRNDDMGGYGM
ncbi:MAG: TonB-dependent receptor [Chlorobiota bacterium]|nr:TonB-dependent receptor [Chlorobiota bacterium]QQS66880.1 MAG: TonB-dependent receptor [Chlorobiota bacterium]